MSKAGQHPLIFNVECCGQRRVVGPKGLIFCPACDNPGLPTKVFPIPLEMKKWDVRM